MSTETANPVAAAIAVFEKNVKALAVELPGITFGYIGNVERWGDDRSWEIFLPHPGRQVRRAR
jgi:hypothetical protein